MHFELSELDRQLASLIIPGSVSAVQLKPPRVRVQSGEWESDWQPWLAVAAGQARHWRAPSIGEQAVLINPSGDPAQGFALVGFYTDQFDGDGRADVIGWHMPDGAVLEYNHASGSLLVDGVSSVQVQAAQQVTVRSTRITLDADDVVVTQNLTVGAAINHLAKGGAKASFGGAIAAKGEIHSEADVSAGKISLQGHGHMEQGDGARTGDAVS
ncbi:phage baseplate assembly protein V [Aquitalea sp. ASV11]|uniref:phage baseplate assembly protein V n=1 Tax=Aquitalea sp. ASV11 TaxID=2795103 RepID=UPI0018ED1ECD|nr:phage baseplate assembly protein V [Aquitalea sp. ASV11]